MSFPIPQPLPEIHDPKEKTSMRWAAGALVLGIILAFMSLTEGSFREILASLVLSLAVLVPAGWWFYCNKKDKQALAQARRERETFAYLNTVLTPEDDIVKSGMGAPSPYEPIDRHWILVAAISGILVGLAAALLPTSTEDSDPSEKTQEFATCEDAAEEGHHDIPEGSKYYDIHLDQDKDGIACELEEP